jgi:hypothetical protein
METAMQLFTEQFPDFPPHDMPDFPPEWYEAWGFVDTSWHNAACPSFTSDKLGLHLWVDYADATKREHQSNVARFMLERQDHGIEIGQSVIETDDWDAVLAAIRAEADK